VSQEIAQEAEAKGENAPGVEGEEVVWEARYSMKNFIGRLTARTLLTLGWIALAFYTWAYGHTNVAPFTILLAVGLGLLWITLLYRIIKARYGHYYRLTTRRLFVSTGLMRRRRDQMELLRIKDVYTRQTLTERWLSLGTVVVVSTEQELPTFYLAGVNDPKKVMDLIWHCARAEREGKTVQIENL
jgi:membrane protein YdbS with pleckstrin-like domain